jgi:hypothetical protein
VFAVLFKKQNNPFFKTNFRYVNGFKLKNAHDLALSKTSYLSNKRSRETILLNIFILENIQGQCSAEPVAKQARNRSVDMQGAGLAGSGQLIRLDSQIKEDIQIARA